MGCKVGTITVDCEDPHRLGGFWSALLGVAVVEVGEDYTELAKLSEDGPNLLFLQVPEPKAGKNRLHLDLVVPDVKSAVDSALDLGARPSRGRARRAVPLDGDARPRGQRVLPLPARLPRPDGLLTEQPVRRAPRRVATGAVPGAVSHQADPPGGTGERAEAAADLDAELVAEAPSGLGVVGAGREPGGGELRQAAAGRGDELEVRAPATPPGDSRRRRRCRSHDRREPFVEEPAEAGVERATPAPSWRCGGSGGVRRRRRRGGRCRGRTSRSASPAASRATIRARARSENVIGARPEPPRGTSGWRSRRRRRPSRRSPRGSRRASVTVSSRNSVSVSWRPPAAPRRCGRRSRSRRARRRGGRASGGGPLGLQQLFGVPQPAPPRRTWRRGAAGRPRRAVRRSSR